MSAELLRRVYDRTRGHELILPAIVALAAVLRFSALDARGFWRDEAATVGLVRRSFGGMLSAIPDSEGTPPLYYMLAWGWTHVFGSGEIGLRSLSALIGTGTVVVVYAIGVELVSRRVALAAALLAAVNPFLVWHAQDGRAYAVYTLLGALSFLACVRALRSPGARELVFWVLASALALCTHYFAVFLVVPEAILLLAVRRMRASTIIAVAAVTVVGLALVPLALAQRSSASVGWIAEIPRANRIRELVREFLVGPQAAEARALAVISGACLLTGLWLLLRRSDEQERRAARLVGGTAIAAVALAFAVSLAGADYFLSRNLVVAWVPLAVAVAAGLGSRRAGILGSGALATLAVIGAAVVVSSAHDPKFGSEDWRGAARALGPPRASRAVVLWLGVGEDPFRLYRPTAQPLPRAGATIREVDVVFVGIGRGDIEERRADLSPTTPFRQVARTDREHFTVLRFRSSRAQHVRRSTLVSGPPGYSAAVLLDQR
jgi:mannosyltransferase